MFGSERGTVQREWSRRALAAGLLLPFSAGGTDLPASAIDLGALRKTGTDALAVFDPDKPTDSVAARDASLVTRLNAARTDADALVGTAAKASPNGRVISASRACPSPPSSWRARKNSPTRRPVWRPSRRYGRPIATPSGGAPRSKALRRRRPRASTRRRRHRRPRFRRLTPRPRAFTSTDRAREIALEIVLESTRSAPGRVTARRPSSPRKTASTSLPIGSIVKTQSTSATASRMAGAGFAPSRSVAAIASAERSKVRTVNPALSRFRTMGRPMLPRPTNAIVEMALTLRPRFR